MPTPLYYSPFANFFKPVLLQNTSAGSHFLPVQFCNSMTKKTAQNLMSQQIIISTYFYHFYVYNYIKTTHMINLLIVSYFKLAIKSNGKSNIHCPTHETLKTVSSMVQYFLHVLLSKTIYSKLKYLHLLLQ